MDDNIAPTRATVFIRVFDADAHFVSQSERSQAKVCPPRNTAVEKHRQHVMDKLDVHDTAGLTRYVCAQEACQEVFPSLRSPC